MLIVEDELVIAAHLESVLRQFGYQTATPVNTMKQALDLLGAEAFDIVLLDITLGASTDGLELGKIINSQYRIPFLFITAHSDEKTVREAAKSGPSGYILKPVKETELFSSIEVALQRRQVELQLERSETRFHSFFDNLSIPAIVLEHGADPAPWRILQFNNAASEVCVHLTAGSVPPFSKLFPADTTQVIYENLAEVLTTKRARRFDLTWAKSAHYKLYFEAMAYTLPTGEFVLLLNDHTVEHQVLEENSSLIEELQAANEELLAANEEMQTSNEELSTINMELHASQQELLASENRYHTLFTEMLDGYAIHEFEFSQDGQPDTYRFLEINPAFTRLTGLPPDVIGRTVHDIIPDIESHWIQTYKKVVQTGEPIRFENHVEALKRDFVVSAFKVSDRGFATIFSDVTENRTHQRQIQEALKEKEVLLKEIHHRVKNNMQVISSLLSLEAGVTDKPEVHKILSESKNRVRSMALVHEKLYQSRDFSRINFCDYTESLLQELNRGYISSTLVTYEVKECSMMLDIDTAIPLALIINELTTNSYKYAFPQDRPGKIEITLENLSNKTDWLNFCYRDNGIGMNNPGDLAASKTLGYRLISALTHQICGELSFTSSPGKGMRVDIAFPYSGPLGC